MASWSTGSQSSRAGAHFGQPGYETDLLYLACLVGLVLGGNGPFALDAKLLRRRECNEASAMHAAT